MATILGQRCTVFLDANSVQRFKIESSIDSVLPGDLPIYGPSPYTSNVFVHKIVVAEDPKQDAFLRVANVADLTTLPLGRETALGSAQTIYLSADFSVVYDDIATATQAKTLIQQRVDNLIADWHVYNESFLSPLNAPPSGPPYTYSNITLPLTLSLETELKTAYNTAHAEYLAAAGDAAIASAADAAALTAASAANDNAVSAVAESQQCSSLLGQFNSGTLAVDAFRTASNDLITQSKIFDAACAVYYALTTPSAGDKTTFNNARVLWQGYLSVAETRSKDEALSGKPTLDALHDSMAGACTAKVGAVSTAAAAKADADKAYAEAATEKKAADEAASAAILADTAAYLAVKELCPDFERTVP